MRAGLANFLQIDLVRSKAVEKAVKARQLIVPFARNHIDGGLPFFVWNACLCPLGQEEFGDLESSHEGRHVQRGVPIAIPPHQLSPVLEKEPSMLEPAMKAGRTQGRPTVLGQCIDVGAQFHQALKFGKVSGVNSYLNLSPQLLWVYLLIRDVKNEVVAEQAVLVLQLDEIHPFGRKAFQFDLDPFIAPQLDRALRLPSVDNNGCAFLQVPTAQHHGLVPFGQDGKLLSSALFLNRAFGLDAGLRVVVISVLAMPPGKGSHKSVRIRQFEKLVP